MTGTLHNVDNIIGCYREKELEIASYDIRLVHSSGGIIILTAGFIDFADGKNMKEMENS